MSAFVGTFIVGVVCILLGVSNMRGNISSLHFYHRYRVSEEDRMPFGKKVGIGTILCGCGIIVFSVLSAATLLTDNQFFCGLVLLCSLQVLRQDWQSVSAL